MSRISLDDPRLLELTNSLCQELGIPNLEILQVRWFGRLSTDQDPTPSLPSDWCTFTKHSVIMPVQMMDKLSVDEWRPLIASSLLYERKLSRTLRTRIVALYGGMFILLAGPLIAAALLRMAWIAIFYIIFLGPAIILFRRLYYPHVKIVRLQADAQASDVIGKDVFLEVLKRLDAMSLWDLEKRKAGKAIRQAGSGGLPNLSQRISNLEHMAPI